jgi:hypothetical protein
MRQSGHSLVEATFGLIFIVATVISLIDLSIVIYGVSLNETTCRNAASAGAAGDAREAESRVRVAIEQSSAIGFGTIISRPQLILPVEVNLTSAPMPRRNPETDRMYNPGGLVIGTITVRTQVEIRPLAIDYILKRREPLVFRSSQSFPMHYNVPPG